MKMKKFLSLLTLAAAVFTAPAIARADGDIVDIRVMDMADRRFGDRANASGMKCAPDRPVVAGEEVCIRVRMLVRNADDVDTSKGKILPQTWAIKTPAGGDVLEGAGPALGIMVGETVRWASYSETGVEPWQFSGALDRMDDGTATDLMSYFTDFYFKYRVQPGDMGMPVKLIDTSLKAVESTSTAPSTAYAFMYINVGTQKYALMNADVGEANLFRRSETVTVDWPGDTYPLADYNLEKECLYVKTIDFDTDYANPDDEIWREINRSGVKGSDATLVVAASAAVTESTTVYLWSSNETVAVPVVWRNGTAVKDVVVEGVTKKVLTVEIPAGSSSASFRFKAPTGATVGQTTEIYMSPVQGSVYTDVGGLKAAAVSRTVKVGEDSPPSVCIRVDNKTAQTVTADSDYMSYKAKVQVCIENDDPNRSTAVTVYLKAYVPGDNNLRSLTSLYSQSYLRLTAETEDFPGVDAGSGQTASVSIPAGQSTVNCYAFVLGSTNTMEEAGVCFYPMFGESKPDDIGYAAVSNAMLFVNRPGENGIAVEKTQPESTTASPGKISMSQGESKQLTVYFNDTYRNTKVAKTYTFVLEGTGDNAGVRFAEGEAEYKAGNPTGSCKPNMKLTSEAKTKKTYSVELYGVSPDGSTTERVPFTLEVIDGKSTYIRQQADSVEIGEGESLQMKLGVNQVADSGKYIFIKGVTTTDEGLFQSNLQKQGAPLGDDNMTVTGTKAVKFLDGTESGTEVNLKAVLSDAIDDPTAETAGWGQGTIAIVVTNKPPVLKSLNIAGMPLTVSSDYGTTLDDTVPLGVEKVFKLTTIDEVEADRSHLSVLWTIDGIEYETNDVAIADCTVRHTFTAKTAEGKKGQLVEVKIKDKDMLDWPAEPNFRCWVKVVAKPSISIAASPVTGGIMSETDGSLAQLSVTLSEPATEAIDVLLKIQKPDTGAFKLRQTEGSVVYVEEKNGYDVYRLIFKSGVEKIIIVSELDGTSDTLAGIDIQAEVETEAWKTYYDAGTLMPPLRVQNVAPTIIRPTSAEEAYTNENASANSPYAIYYGASDVDADLKAGLDVEIKVDGKTKLSEKVYDSKVREYSVMFDGAGAHMVEFVYTDKDQMTSRATVWYYVQQSKVLELSAHGPAQAMSSTSGYSSRYQGASGLGAGRVYAGDAGPQKVESFVHKYSFTLLTSSVRAYAYGYKADPTLYDNGTLTPGRDQPIDKNGNWTQGTAISEYYNYALDDYTYDSKHKGADGLDSFVYGWACNNSESSSSSSDSDSSSGSEFMVGIGETSSMSISLPDAENNSTSTSSSSSSKTASVPIQYWEAVFSAELMASDNCGDINGDGVPDAYVRKYLFDVMDSAGQIVGDDLRDVNYTTDETPVPYCAEGDYLPGFNRQEYAGLIPGLPDTWQTIGKEFTPVLKIRGFSDEYLLTDGVARRSALNNAAKLVGLSEIKSETVYTNPKLDENSTLSYVEWLAWSEFKAANPDKTEKDWTPENPTDPTKADTDSDGMTDGYEYWIWYMAHVGWVENYGTAGEVHKRLTGRKYDPRNPGEGTRISADELARLFNPNLGSGAVERDTDNDGLPDVLEFTIGTKPYDFDSDGDGLPDGWEVMIAGYSPTLSSSYVNEPNDRLLNQDGDAMAISSYVLEQGQSPVALDFEHAKRWTLAVIDANGDTDGVQWYAMTEEPQLVEGDPVTSWYKVTVDGVEYCALAQPAVTEKNCLAAETTVYTISEYTPPAAEEEGGEENDGGEGILIAKTEGEEGEEPAAEPVPVLGYPVILEPGTRLDAAPAEQTDELKTFKIGDEGIEKANANACWIYGKGSADALQGEVAESAAEYGCLALGRQLAVPGGAVLCAYPSDERDVAFLHFLCYQEFGFDPRTAWSSTQPLAARWGSVVDGEALTGVTKSGQGGYTGSPSRTRDYRAYDEFLVSSFFYNNTADAAVTYKVPTTAASANTMGKFWASLTTNPQGPVQTETESGDSEDSDSSDATEYYGRNSTEGADTDLDGVPDGWELYVMAGPKKKGAYVFAPPYAGFTSANGKQAMPESYFSPFVASAQQNDTCNTLYTGVTGESKPMNEWRKYAGTDSCNYYSTVLSGNVLAYSTTIVRPEQDATWLNKFFPCDPWVADTDNDGISDGNEGANFIYGTPADNGSLSSIPGGGLNPLSVDTDRDGLPDGWETQFKGSASSLFAGDGASYAKDSDGNAVGNALQGLTDGMDGTVPDAFSYPLYQKGTKAYTVAAGMNQVVNRDYDHDGLENWQEYLTGTMRAWRYDDPVSPMNGIPASAYYKENEEGELVFNAEKAAEDLGFADVNEFWYKTLVDSSSEWYNPHFVTDTSSGAQYFTRVENVWDCAYNDKDLSSGSVSGAYYWFYDRGNGQSLGESWSKRWQDALGIEGYDAVPAMYASCSPIDPDSDHDGMDDYYEVFHGMNPLLGRSGVEGEWYSVNGSGYKNDGEGFDIVYDSLVSLSGNLPQAWGTGDDASSYKNFWQRLWEKRAASKTSEEGEGADPKWEGAVPRGTGYDFWFYPWLTGLATADADGDGIRNQEEAIMPLIAPASAWHHTDPTSLWLTDSSYSNSVVRGSYRMPCRTTAIPLEGEGFTNGDDTYLFKDFDGYVEGDDGNSFMAFVPDQWGVSKTDADMNWIASFEENEGFDTDHDGINDQDELAGKYRGKTDAIDADSPQRRQAMYFQGKSKPSILQTMPFVKEQHPDGEYPDDMSFLQYTVECWVKPEGVTDATIVERALWTDQSNPADREFLRCNFSLGIRGGKWFTKFDPNDTTCNEVTAVSDIPASDTGWTHLAATYDGTALVLYVNGVRHGQKNSGLQPAYGASEVTVDGMSGVHADPGMTYWKDREYKLNAIVIGASFRTCRQGATDGTALDVTRAAGWNSYTNFFKGYIDEVRVWDGARSVSDIVSDMKVRYTSEEVAANRDAFYTEWSKGTTVEGAYRGRYATDENGDAYSVPAELRFHWTFDSAFGAAGESAVAKVPSGYNYAGDDSDVGGRAKLTRPDDYSIAWWEKILAGYSDTVYNDKAWIVWIPNTVTHLPRFDGTTLDSSYWSQDFAGAQEGTYKFARTAEPVSFWTQYSIDNKGFGTTGSRNLFVSMYDATNNTSFGTLYAFTGRHLNLTGDDMLALGGAYVKHIDEMWDDQGASSNWEVAGNDEDADGLPTWWEDWADSKYRDDAVTGKGDITWDTIVVWPDQNGTHMTAGEAYLRDLARGYHCDETGAYIITDDSEGTYRQRYDLDGNGIPDWWEELYGITGCDMYADSDNDGLSNYAEYLLSEVFDFKNLRFSPIDSHSVDPYVLDYFHRIGQLYVGEIFTDHDQVDDAWEGLYPHAFGSRLLYDAASDADSDGWSNRSEVRYAKQCMPTIADKQTHYTAADGLVADYPIPTLSLTLNYNGINRSAAEKAPIIVQVTSGQLSDSEPDAEFSVGELTDVRAGAGTSDTKETDATVNSYTRTIGKWSNRHAIGTLTPGYINKNSLALEFCYDPSSQVYTWEITIPTYGEESRTKRGDRKAYDADRRKYGTANVTLVSRDTDYQELESMELRTSENSTLATWVYGDTGEEVGTVDLTTGAFDLDLGVFAGMYVVNVSNENDYASLEDQTFRIVYSVNPAVDLPRKLYLGEADTGHVREGLNTIEAFMDLDSSGTFTPGEPYGVARNVNVSWKGTSAEIELTTKSPVTPRVTLWAGSATSDSGSSGSSGSSRGSSSGSSGESAANAADRERTIDQIYAEIKEDIYALNPTPRALSNAVAKLAWMDTNQISTPEVSDGQDVRVRVVRWLVDGSPVWQCGVEPRVVFDKTLNSGVAAKLTEKDFLTDEDFDLDWQYLNSEVVNAYGVKLMDKPVEEVDYLIVFGDGVTSFKGESDTNNVIKALSQVIARKYGSTRVKPTLVSPSATGGQTVREASPTFVWSVDEEDVKGYTAFKVQVSDADGVVYDSGLQPVPPRNTAGNYVWTAPLHAGDMTLAGKVYANDAAYSWKVSMYNAKYTSDSFSDSATYLQCVQTNGLEYGSADVAVKYFGPALSYADKVIRVRAYETPDFTGRPVAAGYVARPDDADTGVGVTGKVIKANCRVIGIPAGTYYLQAFIDSNANGTCDAWESSGYLCGRDGSTADWLNPRAMTFGSKVGASELATIYLEEADTDQDSLPDAWEWAQYGSLEKEGVASAELTSAGELVVSSSLAADLLALPVNDVNGGLAGQIVRSLTSSKTMVALASGVEVGSVDITADGEIVAKTVVKDGTLTITDFAYDAAAKKVRFAVAADVEAPTAALESPIYSVTVQSGATVTVRLLHTATLAGEWVEVGSQSGVKIGGEGFEGGVISIDMPDVAAEGGFFKVVVVQ